MNETIDCLFIGHNEMKFQDYAEAIYGRGPNDPAYRDLKLNFIRHKGKRQTVTDIFNLYSTRSMRFGIGDVFSTTIAYLSTYIHKQQLKFDYINDFQQEKEELKKKLLSGNILAVGITTTLYTFPTPISEICFFIRKYNKDVTIIIGGPFILNLFFASGNEKSAQTFLKNTKADFLVNSPQGEAALVTLLKALKAGDPVDNIPNITYWKNGVPKTNPTVPEDNKLDENPINWKLFSHRLGKFVGVRTCLSCPFNCSFCGFCQRAGKHQTAEVQTVEKELDLLENIGTIKSINFVDDTFNVPPKRFKELLKMMIGKKYSFKWNSYFRCQFADQEMIDLMEASGCEGVYLGIESANQEILNNMNKKAAVEAYRRGMTLLKKSNIIIHTNFILGFPGETTDTIKDSVHFIKEFQPDFYRFQLWYFDRITPIWKERARYKIKGSYFMWSHETMDSSAACDLIDEIFLTGFASSTWVPVHNFNLHNLFRLIHLGMSTDNIKGFLNAFAQGIREGIQYPDRTDVTENVILQMKKYVP